MLTKRITETEIDAVGEYIPLAAHKARRVVDRIRGCSYEETLVILKFLPYRARFRLLKLVYSTAANASDIMGSNKANLVISRAEVNEATTVKRLQYRAQGRSYPIKEPTCHITIVMKDISYNEFLDSYAAWSQKAFWKNKYTKQWKKMSYHDRYSNGGAWDKK
uniref:Large ribosomal subunit protein uL22c n=3 Tax=Carpodetus TaxID=54172 RepID=A0A8K1PCW2_9ASTR|nr:ribosomal protein L22 [Carpodetus arboreus]UDN41608.1 ribosomal protein L22 [Carpodetus archboldianus]UDN41696.1 ribosomal protein L22 [Carpodetus montanus]UDN41544.1 ribosomal protein L22 [Carpodetus arboreus]UDN41632.1 ribosomal protein L22 [Carpodetus archboldianus]